ncbi:hypothetical protein BKI52_13125 [marine bacterium AO1-C]|nr:hypothetical protein BKI52_13125 [marine bacterium AO1-C]
MKRITVFKHTINHWTPKPKMGRKVLIVKTNIQTPEQVAAMGSVLRRYPFVIDWSIDTEDVDCVLRVEAFQPLSEAKVIQLVEAQGFYCDALPD